MSRLNVGWDLVNLPLGPRLEPWVAVESGGSKGERLMSDELLNILAVLTLGAVVAAGGVFVEKKIWLYRRSLIVFWTLFGGAGLCLLLWAAATSSPPNAGLALLACLIAVGSFKRAANRARA